MYRSFSLTLLITCTLIAISCKTAFQPGSTTARNIPVDETVNLVDSNLVHIYLPYKNQLEKDMNRVISVSETVLAKNKPESGLTNLLADLLLEEAKLETAGKGLNIAPSVSYFNYGGIRVPLPKGEITVGKIFELMPFENEMVYMQLTGGQLQQFCDVIAGKGGDSVGGVRFVIANEKAKNVMIEGKPLDQESKYWLVTNDYAANGGDDLTVFTQKLQLINSGVKIRDVIIRNLEKRQKAGLVLTEKLDGRIGHE
jgi:2',3'-cyclic-nucleotide 2'-phosphodiesterase (5'-nucleotidase family)